MVTRTRERTITAAVADRRDDILTEEGLLELFSLDDIDKHEDAARDWLEGTTAENAAYKLGWEVDLRFWRVTRECPRCEGDGVVIWKDSTLHDCRKCCGEGTLEVEWHEFQETPEYEQAWNDITGEYYQHWRNALESVADKFFGYHNLRLLPVRIRHVVERQPTPHNRLSKPHRHYWFVHGWQIVPDKSWKDAAEQIAQTISGVGYFHFEDANELRLSYPYPSYKATVLDTLPNMSDYARVYGGPSPQSMFESEFESQLRFI